MEEEEAKRKSSEEEFKEAVHKRLEDEVPPPVDMTDYSAKVIK